MYQDFDALSLMQQAPANFVSEAAMPTTSLAAAGHLLVKLLLLLDKVWGIQSCRSLYAFTQPQSTFRFGLGGLVAQPDNSGSLPGATTTLPCIS